MAHRKCPGKHKHVVIQGKYTKPGAVYHDNVALALADVFGTALEGIPPAEEVPNHGLKNLAVNDVLLSSTWETVSCWRWEKGHHINVLESELYRDLARRGDLRFPVITDSSVVLGSHAKKRTSTKLLKASLRRCSATIIAGGLYPGLLFGPTRLIERVRRSNER